MDVTLPTDCGNAPRIAIVSDIVTYWARDDRASLAEWLGDDATMPAPPWQPDSLEVLAVITHGRLASCDGVLSAGDRQLAFSHVFRFASTSKTAKVADVRSYSGGGTA